MFSYTWIRGVTTAWHPAVLPPSFRVTGVTPGHPLVVGVTTVVLIKRSGKEGQSRFLSYEEPANISSPLHSRCCSLLAGVVFWRAAVFMWRLSRPALARFASLGYSNRAAVRLTLAADAGQLWDNGRRRRCWGHNKGCQTRFGFFFWYFCSYFSSFVLLSCFYGVECSTWVMVVIILSISYLLKGVFCCLKAANKPSWV